MLVAFVSLAFKTVMEVNNAAAREKNVYPAEAGSGGSQNRQFPKLMVWLILFVFFTYVVYTFKLINSSSSSSFRGGGCDDEPAHNRRLIRRQPTTTPPTNFTPEETHQTAHLKHVVFGIAGSANMWEHRKEYIKLWWKPEEEMRGVVWLDSPPDQGGDQLNQSEYSGGSGGLGGFPEVRVSTTDDETGLLMRHSNRQGDRVAIRISRIISETYRLGHKDVRWFVMGDDDTVFVTENLLRVLGKYDHNQYYYIGSLSECHLQNIFFSYSMAFGGGGFAISYPLARALDKMQDRCIQRYPGLFASDDRLQACIAEIGVPLTKEQGFHQYDVFGNLFGLLAAHPVAPFVSFHHLDVVEPIFPNATRVEALQRLQMPIQLDSAAIMQQSICYHAEKKWTISVSWGFAIQIFRGILSPREIEMPSRTFLNWYKRADYTAYAFNTRPVSRNPCQKPFVFYMTRAGLDSYTNQTVTHYDRHRVPHPFCKWKMPDPDDLDRVVVYKKPDPRLWDRSPRRNCCRIVKSTNRSMAVNVGVCREGEVSEVL